jgi:hypothetical protein
MPEPPISIDDRIDAILNDLDPKKKPNFSKLAVEKNVPYQRLLARSKGRSTRAQRPSGTYKLSLAQENALYDYIARLDELGVCVRLPMIVSCANYLLQRGHDSLDRYRPATSRWAIQWLKRNPELHKRRQRSLDLNRAIAHDTTNIKKWFDGFVNIIRLHGITSPDIWNFDESGFRIGIGKDQWVITFEPRRRVYLPTPDDRTSLTMTECVNAEGVAIEPMMIIEGVALLERYFVDLPDNYLIAHSTSGYTNDDLSLEWVRHFERKTRQCLQGRYRLLLFDGFDSHCTQEFLEILEDNDIIAYRLPPHTSHFLQPLDVSCFQPYKHWHAEAVDQATRTGCTTFNKVEFMAAIESIRHHTFKRSTIRKGWHDTGLIPPNWTRLASNIQKDVAELARDYNGDTDDSEDEAEHQAEKISQSTPPPHELKTPLTIRTLKRNIDHCLDHEDLSENVKRTLFGAYNMSVSGDQAIGELQTMTSVAQSRRQRQQRSRTLLKSSMGVIYSQDARRITQKRLGDEIAMLQLKYSKMKGMPAGQKKEHAKHYRPIHDQLELVWASMRASGILRYENHYDNWQG